MPLAAPDPVYAKASFTPDIKMRLGWTGHKWISLWYMWSLTTCRGALGHIWLHFLCSVNTKAFSCISDNDTTGKYTVNAGCGGRFGESAEYQCNKITSFYLGRGICPKETHSLLQVLIKLVLTNSVSRSYAFNFVCAWNVPSVGCRCICGHCFINWPTLVQTSVHADQLEMSKINWIFQPMHESINH